MDVIGHSIAIFDQDERLVLCNRYYRDSYRVGDRVLPADIELTGKTYRELMELRVRYKLHKEFADDPESFVKERLRRFRAGTTHIVHLANGAVHRSQYLRLADGGRCPFSDDLSEIIAGEQRRAQLEAQLQLAQAAAALQQSERCLADKSRVLEATLEHMGQGILMIDGDGIVAVCNQRAVATLGLPAAKPALPMTFNCRRRRPFGPAARDQWRLARSASTSDPPAICGFEGAKP